jgi:hypothetical protein
MTKINSPKWRIDSMAVVLLLQVSGSMVLNAQQVYFGIKGGWGLPQLSGGTNEVSKGWMSRSAFNFGILGSREFSDRIAVQIEINYASQGGKKNGIQPLGGAAIPGLPAGLNLYADFKNTAILNYLEVPVLIKYNIFSSPSVKFYVDAGPYFGYLLNAHDKTLGSGSLLLDKNGTLFALPNPSNPSELVPLPSQNFDANTSITSDINKFNIGLNGGIGIGQSLGNGDIFLDVKGYYGFLNIQKNPVNGKNNTGALVVSIGYVLKI